MQMIRQIKVGKHNTDVVGLDNILKEILPGIDRHDIVDKE